MSKSQGFKCTNLADDCLILSSKALSGRNISYNERMRRIKSVGIQHDDRDTEQRGSDQQM